MVAWGAIIPAVAAGAKSLFSSVGSGSGNSIWSTLLSGGLSMLLGNQAYSQTKEGARDNFIYNSWLQQQQFKYNRYFAEHAHQMEVQDLRNAGLNPILSANGGATASVSGASASTPDYGSSYTSGINSATALADMVSNLAVKKSQVGLQASQSKNLEEQSATEAFKRKHLESQAKVNDSLYDLNILDKTRKQIENSFLPETIKSEIFYKLKTATANSANAVANNINARASMMNATEGNLTRYLIHDVVKPIQAIVDDKLQNGSDLGAKYYKYKHDNLNNYLKGALKHVRARNKYRK